MDERPKAIRFWEIGRIVFLAVVAYPAWFGYMIASGIQAGLGYPQNGTTTGVFVRFGGLFLFLNFCFCMAYAGEFLFGKMKFWPVVGRGGVLVLGAIVGAFVAFKGGAMIGFYEFSFR